MKLYGKLVIKSSFSTSSMNDSPDAMRDGFMHYHNDGMKDDCPHEDGSPEHKQWHTGFDIAMFENLSPSSYDYHATW